MEGGGRTEPEESTREAHETHREKATQSNLRSKYTAETPTKIGRRVCRGCKVGQREQASNTDRADGDGDRPRNSIWTSSAASELEREADGWLLSRRDRRTDDGGVAAAAAACGV
jgi:hypothetical protein